MLCATDDTQSPPKPGTGIDIAICGACAADNDDDANFLQALRSAAAPRCPSCGIKDEDDATFCKGCGGKLGRRAS